jgi:UDP-N-acetylglucosamine--N-acetylmuramyl-(pentapeptide) pyrophosphoryl-undecaprenol N-acetylglucosamine transferase
VSRTIHLVAARGGHLELMQSLKDAFEGYERIWVTEPSARADALVAAGERVELLPPYRRSAVAAARNVRLARELVARTRPRLVVCSGAGLTVPFCVAARAAGARIIFTETMARITNPSMSGRVLSRLASSVFVQWPDMATIYPGATVCRPALLEGIAETAPGGRGTFVAVGTWHQPFDRLLRLVDEAAAEGTLPQPVLVQSGACTYRPRYVETRSFMEPAELEAAIAGAELIVCHAGSGIIACALRAGRRPLVLPRVERQGEHVDDHQLQIAVRLSDYGLAVHLHDRIRRSDVAAAAARLAPDMLGAPGPVLSDALADEIGRMLDSEPAALPAAA